MCSSRICSRTDRQTDTVITILRCAVRGGTRNNDYRLIGPQSTQNSNKINFSNQILRDDMTLYTTTTPPTDMPLALIDSLTATWFQKPSTSCSLLSWLAVALPWRNANPACLWRQWRLIVDRGNAGECPSSRAVAV